MKSPKTEIDYGPEFRKSEIAEALKMSIGEGSPLDIKLNEFSQTDLTRVIRGRTIIDLLESVGLTIVKREETPRQLQLNMVEEKITYDLSENHNNKKLIREYLDCTNKITMRAENCTPLESPAPTAFPTSGEIVEKSLKLFPQMAEDQSEDPRVTYHQLKLTERTIAPPNLVRESANCGGIVNCQINITDVEFDQVNWRAYNKGDKIHIKITTSKDVPYLSRILEKCQQGSVPIKQEGKPEKDWTRLLVTFCETIRNFKKGD